MEELIQRLDSWLRQNRPDYYKKLLPGLTELELTDLEKELGVELPTDFKTFYRWRNGVAWDELECIVPNFEWLSNRGLISHQNTMSEADEDGTDYFPDWENWWGPGWITFLTDGTANYYCLDMEGSFGGKKGQILSIWTDDIHRDIFHESFFMWLETVIIALERGLFRGDEDDTRLQEYETYSELEREINPGYPIRHEARFIGN